ncbi:MAG: ATP-dependent DNA helicase RecG [Bacilli bacterium]|jgi:ATP-dependent DNA helicase RecG|nr:ATP-dependent DNA helicase RecG [Erysipelotrichia bacterium]
MNKFYFSKSQRINLALDKMGISSFNDLLLHLPRKYESFMPTREYNLEHKERVVFHGFIAGEFVSTRFNKVQLTRFTFTTLNGNSFQVEAWNRQYLIHLKKDETPFTLVAYYDYFKNKLTLLSLTKGVIEKDDYLRPIYSLPMALSNFEYIRLVERAFLKKEDEIETIIPTNLVEKYKLISKEEALKLLHRPKSNDDIHQGLRVLKYEECLLFSLKTLVIRKQNKQLIKNKHQFINLEKVKQFINSLPFTLTNDQKTSLNEILKDMNEQSLMYRLLQGDVGTGKTLVSLIAMYANFLRNDQAALMAPTDALARQHFKTLRKLFEKTNVRIALLVGATPKKEAYQIKLALINHQIDIVVGTHALFSSDVTFSSLGLAIIDEQHRFGVNQRLLLASKGEHADLLLMSATPIPRTLALTLYGDLDVSTLNEFPFQKRNIVTKIIKENDQLLFQTIKEEIAKDKRIFVVAPVIDEGLNIISVNELFEKFKLLFPQQVSLLHGQMNIDEKTLALSDFQSGRTSIIVSTSVIEVGLDIKEASTMIIYNPTSFGLASLHQLRGRIGRDGNLGYCYLIYSGDDEDDLDKLNVLVKSEDGFFIAEEDLRRRGPGELSGLRQSGIANFEFVNLVDDFKMFMYARKDAENIIENKDEKHNISIVKKALEEISLAKFSNV